MLREKLPFGVEYRHNVCYITMPGSNRSTLKREIASLHLPVVTDQRKRRPVQTFTIDDEPTAEDSMSEATAKGTTTDPAWPAPLRTKQQRRPLLRNLSPSAPSAIERVTKPVGLANVCFTGTKKSNKKIRSDIWSAAQDREAVRVFGFLFGK